MMSFLDTVFNTERYSGSIVERARMVYGISLLLVVATMLAVFVLPQGVSGTTSFVNAIEAGDIGTVIAAIILIIISTSMFGAVRLGYLEVASWVLTIALLGLQLFLSIDGFDASTDFVVPAFTIVLTALLIGEAPTILVGVISVVSYIAASLLVPIEFLPFSMSMIVTYVVITIVTIAFLRFAQASRVEGEELEGAERFKLANINMQITQQASERQSLEVAMNATLTLILENYPSLYHAQVFLIDEDGVQARLAASTGEVGQRLLEKGHSLAVGSLSVIGQTTLRGEVLVARAGIEDGVHRQNQLLPETTMEAAFPLIVAGQIIGALDLQSKTLSELSDSDRLTFQSLANSLALTIDSIQQFEDAKARIAENQRLAEQTRTALRDVERLNQRLIGRAWSEYLSGQGNNLGLTVDFDDDSVEEDVSWTDTLLSAVEVNNFVKDGNFVAIPLSVRGQIIGAMEFELGEDEEFSPEDLELIQEVSNRFGLAAENTRLVEESQRTAQRETLINEITSRFQSAQNVEATLAEAARSLNEALAAERIMIRLGSPQEQANGN